MNRVLVTGGAGFIGSHLCEYILDKDCSVLCLDNLITGSKKNIKRLLDNPNFEFLEADVCQPLVISHKPLDFIFHLASPASPIDYQNYPEETLLTNSIGTLNILNLAKEQKAKILIASTSEIYGDPKEHPQKETYWGNVNSFGPRACYDESKRFAEAATHVFSKKYNIDTRIIRIFNTYGPRMQKDDGRVVSNFINWAISGLDLKIDGDGRQTRSFCYVSDMVEGIKKAMFEDKTKGEIFNLGNPKEFTILELAQKITEMAGSKSKIVFSKEFRKDDPMQRQPDISKAKKVLGWEPKVSLDEGLAKTIEYYKSL
ncbi:MAG: dTDP-glucose 4,6-dehydratase [Candidatus Woesebacteria bacterium GW2011_GWB1_41_10]|uniref:UDP-glucuronate decarboxylase n=1 Tax=Candidatus Woesebacteria bacterium GW2011_GWB1_41_10 TaxID=1618577 RepID=A0A0G0WU73_9BACT|nr:MAG: dTDP-glucose 4,6-dehydratase [Candidatus Woesebacteria bacterium GW2011_GWB1_41_10]